MPRASLPLFRRGVHRPPPAPPRPRPRIEPPATSDRRVLSLASGRRVRTRLAGLFLFLPLLAQVHFDQLVRQAGYPGSRLVFRCENDQSETCVVRPRLPSQDVRDTLTSCLGKQFFVSTADADRLPDAGVDDCPAASR